MHNEETGGLAQLPDDEFWRARGWTPADPPQAVDPVREAVEQGLVDAPVDAPAEQQQSKGRRAAKTGSE
jgi:predicted TIM-barrel fold metal-dependent hydrolase